MPNARLARTALLFGEQVKGGDVKFLSDNLDTFMAAARKRDEEDDVRLSWPSGPAFMWWMCRPRSSTSWSG